MTIKKESAYSVKLRDPRWQKVRLKIMERDSFACCKCGDSENMLSVHHRYYIWGREPWEYADYLLVTICQSCHNEEHAYEDGASDLIKILKGSGFFNSDISDLANLFNKINLKYPPSVFIAALEKLLATPNSMQGFLDEYFQTIEKENAAKKEQAT
jgi:hypothetical protein